MKKYHTVLILVALVIASIFLASLLEEVTWRRSANKKAVLQEQAIEQVPAVADTQNIEPEESIKSPVNYEAANDYILDSGCSYDMSNNAYTNCAEDALNKIKEVKKNDFKKLKELMNSREDNVLTSNQEENQKLYSWYESSEKANSLRCLVAMYWTRAGSAYNQNIYMCEIQETLTDIEIINENYKEIKEWIDTMDIY